MQKQQIKDLKKSEELKLKTGGLLPSVRIDSLKDNCSKV